MHWLDFYTAHPTILLVFVGFYGAIVGSFLNVVIYRYPLMLKNQWRADCHEFLESPTEKSEKLSLSLPRSHCPHCKKVIPAWHNIPLLSYLFLRGKCAYCKAPISWQYPLVELISTVLTVYIVAHFGLTVKTPALLLLTWTFIALTGIDFHHRLLPDTLTLSLLWIGLFLSTANIFVTPVDAIYGAMIGFSFLWVIAYLYKMIKKQTGMGHGDFKMLAMIGAWVGPSALLNVILLSSLLALFVSLILLCARKMNYKNPIPFGPFLAIGGWCTLVHGAWLVNLVSRWL